MGRRTRSQAATDLARQRLYLIPRRENSFEPTTESLGVRLIGVYDKAPYLLQVGRRREVVEPPLRPIGEHTNEASSQGFGSLKDIAGKLLNSLRPHVAESEIPLAFDHAAANLDVDALATAGWSLELDKFVVVKV